MATRTRYLLAYDIRAPRRLRRVHEVAKGYGDPLQYSIFVCDLSGVELVALRSDLLEEMNLSQDSVAIFDLGPPASRGVECIEFIGVRRDLPDGGAIIW